MVLKGEREQVKSRSEEQGGGAVKKAPNLSRLTGASAGMPRLSAFRLTVYPAPFLCVDTTVSRAPEQARLQDHPYLRSPILLLIFIVLLLVFGSCPQDLRDREGSADKPEIRSSSELRLRDSGSEPTSC